MFNEQNPDNESSNLASTFPKQGSDALERILDLPLLIHVELGNRRMRISELLQISVGSILDLDAAAGAPEPPAEDAPAPLAAVPIASGASAILDGVLDPAVAFELARWTGLPLPARTRATIVPATTSRANAPSASRRTASRSPGSPIRLITTSMSNLLVGRH